MPKSNNKVPCAYPPLNFSARINGSVRDPNLIYPLEMTKLRKPFGQVLFELSYGIPIDQAVVDFYRKVPRLLSVLFGIFSPADTGTVSSVSVTYIRDAYYLSAF